MGMEAVKTRGVAWVACGLLLGASVAPPPLPATEPSSETAPQPPKAPSANVERLYHDAQRQYQRGNYAEALPALQHAWTRSAESPAIRSKRLAILDEIGRIYLREQHDPKGAIVFFTAVSGGAGLSEAEQDSADEWLSAAREWEALGAFPGDIQDADRLFALGKRYHQLGITERRHDGTTRNAQLHIAASYLVPFIVHYDRDRRIGEGLFMMGEIRSYTFPDPDYWVQNFYLKEVIRRFPHTPLALQAWERMRDEVTVNYSGSGGDFTPPSVLKMLETYRSLAEPQ